MTNRERDSYSLSEQLSDEHAGRRLMRELGVAQMHSLQTQAWNLVNLPVIDAVLFIGSSGTGKTTLERIVRSAAAEDPDLSGKVSVPLKVITRALRPGERDVIHVTPEAFDHMAEAGELGIHGVKYMEQGRREKFGLLPPGLGTLPVYFVNNAIIKNPENIWPPGIAQHALIITVYAPEEVRANRIHRRSQELFLNNPEETAFRLSDEERAANFIPPAHIVIHNYGLNEMRTGADLIGLMKLLVQGRDTAFYKSKDS